MSSWMVVSASLVCVTDYRLLLHPASKPDLLQCTKATKSKGQCGARLVTYGEANHTAAAAGLTVGLGHTLNLILLLDGIAA